MINLTTLIFWFSPQKHGKVAENYVKTRELKDRECYFNKSRRSTK